ncbi:MAG: alpha-D-ribose 1-methylphosphonate 5-triphosphate diphosphatase, partial [Actinomycetota bacterium]
MTGDRLILTNVRAVLPDRVVDDATVVCDQGRIEAITERVSHRDGVDGHGALCLPGLVDTHSDGLEKEIRPRRTSAFPVEFALTSFEGKLRAAGITTVFHGIGFEERPDYGRTLDQARRSVRMIAERRPAEPSVDHRLLFRLEARSQDGLATIEPDLRVLSDWMDGSPPVPPLLSFEDHTPGQGQYRDVERFARAIDPTTLPEGQTVEDVVERRIAEANAKLHLRDRNLAGVRRLARSDEVTLLAHDIETAEQIETAHDDWGAEIAEFPLTVSAARRARELEMAVVAGAPNVVLGGSHSGNVSAAELVANGVCTALASDYQPSTLLAAAFALAANRITDLASAVRLVTDGPAALAGLTDRGRLEVGRMADLTLVDDRGAWPVVIGASRARSTSGDLVG